MIPGGLVLSVSSVYFTPLSMRTSMTRAYQDMDTMTTFTDGIVSVTLACGVGGTLLALLLLGGIFRCEQIIW